jgi:hypothetical protein
MLGNDQYGDCVAVTWANVRRLVTASLTAGPSYPDMAQVAEFYRTQNPGFPAEDNGMDIHAALERLASHGGPDGVRAVAFVKVDPSDTGEVKAALAIFGYLWTGVIVTQANERQFAAGEPWDADPQSPQAGGHSVLTGGYGVPAHGSAPALGGDEKFITWAAETSFTGAFWASQCDEAWAVIWPEHLGSAEFLAGIDFGSLDAGWQDIGGSPLPRPVPPGPDPLSPERDELEAIFDRIRGFAGREIAAAVRFLREHGYGG